MENAILSSPIANPVLSDLTAEEFVSGLSSKAEGEFPLTCTMDITEACPHRCTHCYLGARRLNQGRYMLETDACATVRKLAEMGALVLVLTGGEPLSHPSFRRIYTEAREAGLLVTISTNATLCDERMADFLREHPPRRIEISLLGVTQETYEGITRTPGSFDRFVDGVDRLCRCNSSITFRYPVLKRNRDEVEQAREWAEQHKGAFHADSLLVPALDGGRAPLRERVNEEHNGVTACDDCSPGNDMVSSRCGAGHKTLHIDVAGNVYPCAIWRCFSLPVASLERDAWNRHMVRVWENHAVIPGQGDSDSSMRRCAGIAYLEGCDGAEGLVSL